MIIHVPLLAPRQPSSASKMTNKKRIDDHLVKAYENILRKCKDPPLKEMARQCLKEAGCLRENTASAANRDRYSEVHQHT